MLERMKSRFGLSLLIFLLMAACSAPATSSSTEVQSNSATTYTDPFAYCTAAGTIDAPDARYTGPKMPDSVIQGMIAKGVITADMPAEIQKNAVWRCMDAHVWACHFGANLPCLEKADTSDTPGSEMEDYCKANPDVDSIPAAVTGRATVYEWKCSSGKPAVAQQVFQVDPQGYLANFWYELSPRKK